MTESIQKQTVLSRYWWLCLIAFLIGFSIQGGWEILNFQDWSYDMRYRVQDQSEIVRNVVMWMLLRGPGLGALLALVVMFALLGFQAIKSKRKTDSQD